MLKVVVYCIGNAEEITSLLLFKRMVEKPDILSITHFFLCLDRPFFKKFYVYSLKLLCACNLLLVLKVNLDKLDKMTNYGAESDDPNRKVTGNFALYSAAGTKSGAVVYFELEAARLATLCNDYVYSKGDRLSCLLCSMNLMHK